MCKKKKNKKKKKKNAQARLKMLSKKVFTKKDLALKSYYGL